MQEKMNVRFLYSFQSVQLTGVATLLNNDGGNEIKKLPHRFEISIHLCGLALCKLAHGDLVFKYYNAVTNA